MSILYAMLAGIGAFFEYAQHKEFQKKHPDYEKCPSGIIGYILLFIPLFADGIKELIK